MVTTAYFTHPSFEQHSMLTYEHPERPDRIRAVWSELETSGLLERLNLQTPVEATDEQILRVHHDDLLDALRMVSQQDRLVLFTQDTYALPQSPSIARFAAGASAGAVDLVMNGAADNALVAVRPPGHHATPDQIMGFCLLNNIAIAAHQALAMHKLERVLIVDFDVHHGNGTQDIFYDDQRVFFVSLHQYGNFFPGSGALDEIGTGDGQGYTLNVPLRRPYGDAAYATLYKQIVWPAARRFQPQLILVSAGFDAHFVDPLARMRLSLRGYAHLTRELLRMADELCDGKIVFVMEGGYDLQALSHGIRNTAHALLGEDDISDPYGVADASTDTADLIHRVQTLHNL